MTKRKKVTRAYKIGHTDGRNGEHKNPYSDGSQQSFDYERGYDEGKPGSECSGDCTRLTVEEVSGC